MRTSAARTGVSLLHRLAGLGLLTLGCGQVAPPAPSCRGEQRAGIVGGSADPGPFALDEVAGNIGFLFVEAQVPTGETIKRLCTVTRLGPGVALSAGHCVRGGFSALELSVGFSARMERECGTGLVPVSTWKTRDPDLLLVRYADESGAPGLRPWFSPLAAGDSVILAGYGQTEEATQGERRFLPAKVVDTPSQVTITQASSGGACAGDSGGPLLWRNPEGEVFIAGVLSRGSPSCLGTDEYLQLGPARAWLESSGELP